VTGCEDSNVDQLQDDSPKLYFEVQWNNITRNLRKHIIKNSHLVNRHCTSNKIRIWCCYFFTVGR
jgi:hypothetical protein